MVAGSIVVVPVHTCGCETAEDSIYDLTKSVKTGIYLSAVSWGGWGRVVLGVATRLVGADVLGSREVSRSASRLACLHAFGIGIAHRELSIVAIHTLVSHYYAVSSKPFCQHDTSRTHIQGQLGNLEGKRTCHL